MHEQEIDKKIEAALSREPDFQLPPTFANRLVSLIEAKQKSASKREIFWIAFAGFLFAVAVGVSVYLTGFKPSFNAFPFLNNYGGLVVFGVFFIGLLNWLEKRLLKTKNFTT
jgi:high-affinity Fe2+/Pb2+ permease